LPRRIPLSGALAVTGQGHASMQSNHFANIVSGSLIALVNISVAVSVAALLFAQADPRLMVPGIGILLVGTLVTGLGGTLFSHFPAIICSPRNGLVPVFAVMVAGIFASFDGEYSVAAEATIIAAFMITTMITGLFLLLLGRLKLGNLVRYIPYPVSGGFFAGIGYIFVEGGITVATSQEPSLSALASGEYRQLMIPAVVLAVCLASSKLLRDNRFAVPGILLMAMLLFYAVLYYSGISLQEAAARDWLPSIESTGALVAVFHVAYFEQINWLALSGQMDGIIVVALLSSMMLLLDVSGVELIARDDLDPDHELQVMGFTNMVNSCFGGFPGVHDVSDTARQGTTYRLCLHAAGRCRYSGGRRFHGNCPHIHPWRFADLCGAGVPDRLALESARRIANVRLSGGHSDTYCGDVLRHPAVRKLWLLSSDCPLCGELFTAQRNQDRNQWQ
ncbi:MAG: SulP family inorganic anion transporter, partial [Gammaproteobacteria bacterium]